MRSQTLTRRRPFNALGSDVWNGDHDRYVILRQFGGLDACNEKEPKLGLASQVIRSPSSQR